MVNKKLSIITINYNNADGLKKTIESVVHQSFKDIEYIIIDGGSLDGSTEIIKEYSNQINYYTSEKDDGIYNAMNKGIIKSNGEYLLFLNSGDYFVHNNIIETFIEGIEDYDLIYGDEIRFYLDGKTFQKKYPDLLSFSFLAFFGGLPHQASLIKRSLFVELGLYDENFKIISDWKFFMLAIFKKQCKYLHKDLFVVYYNFEGMSSKFIELSFNEREIFLKEEFPNFIPEKFVIENYRNNINYYYKLLIIRILRKLRLIKNLY